VWSFVGKKQSRLTVDERQERHDLGDTYLWTAIDQDTKLVASFAIGKRSADNARRFLLDLSERIVIPGPHASDNHAFHRGDQQVVLQLSSDAFAAYPEAVDLAFGGYARYGQLIKNYRNATMVYTPSEMVGAERRPIFGDVDPYSICTSHVERHNLTIRTFLKRFNRLTICFSKKLENHAAAVAMFLAYYNYCWRTRKPGKSGRLRVPGAMAAGLTDRLWSFADLFEAVS
jgi:IS1 family transposase